MVPEIASINDLSSAIPRADGFVDAACSAAEAIRVALLSSIVSADGMVGRGD